MPLLHAPEQHSVRELHCVPALEQVPPLVPPLVVVDPPEVVVACAQSPLPAAQWCEQQSRSALQVAAMG